MCGFWLLLKFHDAGFRFNAGMALSEMMRPGETLPTPSATPSAICTVGYAPRDHNTIIATLLAQGAPLECRIVAITLDAEPWKMIEAEIRLVRNGDAAPPSKSST